MFKIENGYFNNFIWSPPLHEAMARQGGEMKRITRMSLFWIGVVVAAFLVSSACFILIAGYVWATNKISVFLDKLCIIWDLHIPNAFLDMLPHSIVGSFILTLIAILFYFLFFSQTFPDPEE